MTAQQLPWEMDWSKPQQPQAAGPWEMDWSKPEEITPDPVDTEFDEWRAKHPKLAMAAAALESQGGGTDRAVESAANLLFGAGGFAGRQIAGHGFGDAYAEEAENYIPRAKRGDEKRGSFEWFRGGLADMMGQLTVQGVVGRATGPVGGAVMGGAAAGEAYYQSAREQGLSEEAANEGAVSLGLASAALEKIPLTRMLKGKMNASMKSFVLDKLASGAAESATEIAQEALTMEFEARHAENPDAYDDYYGKLFDSGVFSFGAGTLGSAGLIKENKLVAPPRVKDVARLDPETTSRTAYAKAAGIDRKDAKRETIKKGIEYAKTEQSRQDQWEADKQEFKKQHEAADTEERFGEWMKTHPRYDEWVNDEPKVVPEEERQAEQKRQHLESSDRGKFYAGIPFRFKRAENADIKGIRRQMRKYFMPDGLWNKRSPEFKERMEHEIAGHERRARHLDHNLRKALKATKKGKLETADLELLDKSLKGDEAANKQVSEEYSPEVVFALREMREHVDSLSRKLKHLDGIEGTDLQLTIDENEGTYITRTYAKHTMKDFRNRMWREKTDVIQAAKDELAEQHPEMDNDQLNGMLEYIMDKDSAAAHAAGVDTTPIANAADVLLKRKDIPEVIRDLMGENKNPFANYMQSVRKVATVISQREFATELMDQGKREGWLSDKPTKEAFREVKVADKNGALEPLKGKHGDPEIVAALDDLFSPKGKNAAWDFFVKMSTISKYMQTVGSVKGGFRNFLGNVPIAIANGDFDFTSKEGVKATMKSLRMGGLAHKDTLGKTNTAQQMYLEELTRRGIIGTDLDTRMLNELVELAFDNDTEVLSDEWVTKTFHMARRKGADWYQAQDAFWKIHAYEMNKRRYQKAFPDHTKEQIAERAAEVVKSTYPNYDRAWGAAKAMSKFPFVAPFVMFTAEMARTSYNRAVLANKDLMEGIETNNKELKKIGATRKVSQLAGLFFVRVAAEAVRLATGVSDEEEEDIREHLAPWAKNSALLFLGEPKDGKFSVIDLGYTDPFDPFWSTAFALGSDRNPLEVVKEEVFGEDLFWGRVGEAIFNTNLNTGAPVRDSRAFSKEGIQDTVEHVGAPLFPATAKDARRVLEGFRGHISGSGLERNPYVELASFSGFRQTSIDVESSMVFTVRNVNREKRTANQELMHLAKNRGTISTTELKNRFKVSQERIHEANKRLSKQAWSAYRLGVPIEKVRQILVDQGVAKRDLPLIMAEQEIPFRMTKATRAVILSRPGGEERLKVLFGE